MKVWIDLSNSPHPLLFAPVVRQLEARGHDVVLTARDNAQTVELTRQRWPEAEVIGGESPPGRAGKASAILRRVAALRRWARSQSPDVAVSHNSYSQILAARLARIPIVTAMDFEHQPANHLAFRLADAVLIPEVMPRKAIERYGARDGKVHSYPGLKEELYLGDFEPDHQVLDRLGIERGDGTVVLVRTPPSRALYHRFENFLFPEVLETLGRQSSVRAVALTRHREQREAIAALGLDNVVVPETAVDSRSLTYVADLVIGAGGTMTREAALMGVPTLTMFAGEQPAVDGALETQGRLERLRDVAQIEHVERRARAPEPIERLRARSEQILEGFLDLIAATAKRTRKLSASLTVNRKGARRRAISRERGRSA
jgi:predicted glycosyltransferase